MSNVEEAIFDEGAVILRTDKQAELCYNDTLKVIADAKQKIFDITKWTVTLQTLVLGVSFSKEVTFSNSVIALPVFIGAMGLSLNYATSTELETHRLTLARMRLAIGGFLLEHNKDHVNHYLKMGPLSHKNYYKYYRRTNEIIVVVSSLIAFLMVCIQSFYPHQ